MPYFQNLFRINIDRFGLLLYFCQKFLKMRKILLLIGFIIAIAACSSNNNDSSEGNNYDRTALLTNWADNIIVPSYKNYQTKLEDLVASANTFTTTANEANLQNLRTSWLETYKAYQYIGMYNFGKALSLALNQSTNTYPTDKSGIDAKIASGNYTILSYPIQGLPALDYLINGLGANDTAIVAFYTTNPNASNYKLYLTTLVGKLKTTIDSVVTDWNSGYRNTYISANGTTVESSVSKTTNSFVEYFEKEVRRGKVGIPAGLFSDGVLYPEKVEAVYKNDVSKELFIASLHASQDFFNGKNFNNTATGPGLKSYLDYLNSVRNGQNLSDIINNQFTTIFTTTDALNNSFSQQVSTGNAKMINTYNALQQNVVYIKLDMMQALNISIGYVDGDGD